MTERDPHDTMTEDTRRTTNRPTTERTDYRPELGDVSHTNPYTGTVFGDTQTYSRGRTVAADGGEANGESRPSSEAEASEGGEANGESRPSSEAGASDGREQNVTDDAEATDGGEANSESRASLEVGASDGDDERDVDEEVMKDVAHKPPGDADGAQAAYDRGAGDE